MTAPRKQAEPERKTAEESGAEAAERAFMRLLCEHMDKGTRPGSGSGQPRQWDAGELGKACGVSDRAVRNWRNGTNPPTDIQTLERVLFGDDPDHAEALRTFHHAWAMARQVEDPKPPAPPPPSGTGVLPPTRCLGRDPETAALLAALDTADPAALLVLGAAGIGKTTLTRRVATRPAVVARFGPRRYFVPLETITDPATLPAAIIQAIGLNPAGTSFPAALAVLAQQPTLLVLDNLETPWEAGQRATEDVLQALATTPNVSLLGSLRGTVPPQSPAWTAPPTRLAPLSDSAARDLFLALAPAADPEPLGWFLVALGGVPLALELVAYRAAGDTPLSELWTEWQRIGPDLIEHPDRDPGRLTSLRRSLDLSWGSPRLRDPGRRLFRLLGALPAGLADPDRATLLGSEATEAARQLRATGLAFIVRSPGLHRPRGAAASNPARSCAQPLHMRSLRSCRRNGLGPRWWRRPQGALPSPAVPGQPHASVARCSVFSQSTTKAREIFNDRS